jgi:hypothetical protein
MHQSFCDISEGPSINYNSDAKAPAKTQNCVFQLINISDEMCQVMEKYQQMNNDYDNLAFVEPISLSIGPSVKLEHSWSKLEIFLNVLQSLTVRYLRTTRKWQS